jgi:polymorphic membrane protein
MTRLSKIALTAQGGPMDYFRSTSIASDSGIVAAWDSQVAAAAELPSLRQILSERGAELFPEFSRRYAEIRALPRSARRALQRKLAASRDLANIPAEWRRKLAYSITGAALLLALGGAAEAGTINVTAKTAPDVNDGDFKCSLIEAIVNANNHNDTAHPDCTGATAGPNTLVLTKGSQIFTQSVASYGGENLAGPSITSDITISGNGAKIIRAKGTPNFLFLHVATGGKLTLQDAIVSGFAATSSTAGALYNGFGASLVIENSVISGNTAGRAGAISNIGYLKITDSVLSKNSAGTHAGAIYNYANTTLIISNTLITGNTAGRRGGAIFSKYAHVHIDGSTFSKNSVGNATNYQGGAIYSRHDYDLEIDSSIITGNRARYGGGIYVHNTTLTLDHDIISKNSSYIGGGVAIVSGKTYVSYSTITGNKVNVNYSGGGIRNYSGKLYVDHTTISKNSAGYGGGVQNAEGTFTLTNSTITGNKAAIRGGGVDNTDLSSVFNYDGTDTISRNKAPTGPDIYSP